MDKIGDRSEPDGAPTTRSNMSVTASATYTCQNGVPSPNKFQPQNTDRRNSGPNNNGPFNLAGI
jgi:hypothetical protein